MIHINNGDVSRKRKWALWQYQESCLYTLDLLHWHVDWHLTDMIQQNAWHVLYLCLSIARQRQQLKFQRRKYRSTLLTWQIQTTHIQMNVGLQWLWYIGHFHVNLKKKKAVEYPVISWVMSTSSRIYNPASLPRMLVTVL